MLQRRRPNVTCSEGGVLHGKNENNHNRLRQIEESGGDRERRERPPPNRGDLRPFVETRCNMSLLRPQGVAIVLIYPCGKAQKQPPFPSRFIVSDRSSPSRVRFAASRPGRLRADPKDALLTRGKGGSGRGARRGESRMIKDIIIHIWGEAERNLSALPAALSRSRGALSPAGP